MNYLDLVIILFVGTVMYFGYRRGFIRDTASLLALGLALLLASLYYPNVGNLITSWLGMPPGFAGSAGFFAIWFLVEFVYFAIDLAFYDKIPEKYRKAPWNKWAGLMPGSLRGILFVWFTVNLFFLLPITGMLETQFKTSFVSKALTKNNATLGDFLGKTFGPAAADTIKFLTVKPQSGEVVQLGFKTTEVSVDSVAAKQMLDSVNKERLAKGLKPLVMDERLAKVGEEHARDMFARGYFSHNTPEGVTPFDRMNTAGINFLVAGENLAFAQSVDEAMTGLMDSPGHKANILSADYGKVGIGVIDGGGYGKMFTQEFTN